MNAGAGWRRWAVIAVVDASVVIDWIAPGADPSSPSMKTLRRLIRANDPVIAPELLYIECASALVTGVRRSRWTGSDADGAYGLLVRLPVRAVSGLRHALRRDRRGGRHCFHNRRRNVIAAVGSPGLGAAPGHLSTE